MSVVDSYTEGANFWELNQQFKVAEPFKSLYKGDKSKGKKDSSMMMWFIAFCYDRTSKYFKLSRDGEDGKHYVIGSDYCGNSNFYEDNQEVLDPCIAMFVKMEYTAMERHLKKWEDLLDKRTKFLDTQEYTLENFEDLDKMAVGTKKVSDTIKDIMDSLAKEDNSGTVKGGAQPSLND